MPSDLCAKRLKELRTSHGYTQSDIAEKIGFHKSTILRWENGEGTGRIKLPVLDALARIYGVSPIYIMGITDNPVDYREGLPDNAFKVYMQELEKIAKPLTLENRKKLLEMAQMVKLMQDNGSEK